MTDPERLSAALVALCWSPRDLVEISGGCVDDRTVRRWLAGRNPVWPWVLLWLEDIASYLEAHPCPSKRRGDS